MKCIIYGRVSTRIQAEEGYSLEAQIQRLREYAAEQGYEVLAAIKDEGYSGSTLARPGLDRVRDMVAEGGVGFVLAADRDRFARKVVLNGLLEEELARHGCKTKALNDYGDDSPEGVLMRGIQTQFGEYERLKIVERTRRGKNRKVSEGNVLRVKKPPYGFRYGEEDGSLAVHEPEMLVVEKMYRMAAEGLGQQRIKTRLQAEGIASPSGNPVWVCPTIRQILFSDLYVPHSREELAGMGLEGEDAGVWWWGRKQVSVTGYSPVSPAEYNGREYRQHTSTKVRPVEERVGVPVPAYLSRGLVDQARAMLSSNKAKERKYTARDWELRGMLRCGCGWSMGTHTARHGGKSWSYYFCNRRRQEGAKNTECQQKMLRAEETEAKVWGFVSGILLEPERLVESVDEHIEREKAGGRGDPDEQTASLMSRLQQIKEQREKAEDMTLAGLLTYERLREKQAELDGWRVVVEKELRGCSSRSERIRQLEDFRDRCRSRADIWQRLMDEHPDLGEHVVGDMPWANDPFARAQGEGLSNATPEDRRGWYRRLQMEARPVEGGIEVTGLFGERMLCDTETLSTTN